MVHKRQRRDLQIILTFYLIFLTLNDVLSYEHTERQRQRQRQGPLESIVTLQNRSQTHSKRHGKRHYAFQWTLTLPLPLPLGVFIPLNLFIASIH